MEYKTLHYVSLWTSMYKLYSTYITTLINFILITLREKKLPKTMFKRQTDFNGCSCLIILKLGQKRWFLFGLNVEKKMLCVSLIANINEWNVTECWVENGVCLIAYINVYPSVTCYWMLSRKWCVSDCQYKW